MSSHNYQLADICQPHKQSRLSVKRTWLLYIGARIWIKRAGISKSPVNPLPTVYVSNECAYERKNNIGEPNECYKCQGWRAWIKISRANELVGVQSKWPCMITKWAYGNGLHIITCVDCTRAFIPRKHDRMYKQRHWWEITQCSPKRIVYGGRVNA